MLMRARAEHASRDSGCRSTGSGSRREGFDELDAARRPGGRVAGRMRRAPALRDGVRVRLGSGLG